MSTAGALLGPALFLLVGVPVVGFFVPRLLRAMRTSSWPRVGGEIVASRSAMRAASDAEGGGRNEMHRPVVTYRYRVADTNYQGNRIACNDRGMLFSRAFARRTVARYRKGQPCSVAYDPARPQSSLLEPGARISDWIPVAVGIAFVLVGLRYGAMLMSATGAG